MGGGAGMGRALCREEVSRGYFHPLPPVTEGTVQGSSQCTCWERGLRREYTPARNLKARAVLKTTGPPVISRGHLVIYQATDESRSSSIIAPSPSALQKHHPGAIVVWRNI